MIWQPLSYQISNDVAASIIPDQPLSYQTSNDVAVSIIPDLQRSGSIYHTRPLNVVAASIIPNLDCKYMSHCQPIYNEFTYHLKMYALVKIEKEPHNPSQVET